MRARKTFGLAPLRVKHDFGKKDTIFPASFLMMRQSDDSVKFLGNHFYLREIVVCQVEVR